MSCKNTKKKMVCDVGTIEKYSVKRILSENKEMHLIRDCTMSRGKRIQNILFVNLLDTSNAKESLVSHYESQHEIHIYAKRVACLSLVLSAHRIFILRPIR